MQLIQKMTLTLLTIGLLPVLLVGAIFYVHTASSLRDRELNQLETIAAIQQSRIEHLIEQNNLLLTNYTARVALRANIDRFNLQGRAADQKLVQQSVATLQAGEKSFRSVSILNPTGIVIASTQTERTGHSDVAEDYFKRGRVGVNTTSTIVRNNEGGLSLYLMGPFILEGRLVGVAVIESDMSSFLDLVHTYTGLGLTGETMIVRLNNEEQATYILPLRFDNTASLQRSTDIAGGQTAVARALAHKSETTDNDIDYRGQPILAATRYIKMADWGLVVKIDRAEAYRPLTQLSDLLLVVMFILSVAIILVAFYLARRLNEPIVNLAVVADRIRSGDLAARADVTTKDEIGQLAGTFNAMVENVEKVDQMKSEFVLLTSHQLRTPATAVKGFMSMLLDGYAGKISSQQKKLVEAAYEENERQISVINSILDVARMEAGEMILVRRMYDVGKILEASAGGQASLLKAHGQTAQIVKPAKPVELWVDPTKLQLVIDNFIHNAIKYSPRGTTITATLKHGQRETTIEIRDQGFGIARRDLPRLFKRFSRIAGPHTANVQGAGLGLYLAEKLVAMHGGSISVHSQEGTGTKFVITLPNSKEPTS